MDFFPDFFSALSFRGMRKIVSNFVSVILTGFCCDFSSRLRTIEQHLFVDLTSAVRFTAKLHPE